MKLDDAELDQSFFEHAGTKVDQSVGYILAGLVVVLFFSLFLLGLFRIQTVSSQVVGGGHSRTANEEPRPEIGDAVEATKN